MPISFTINLRTLKAVAVAAGTEETRYYLNGVNLEYSPDALIMVATDGHRIIAARQEWTETTPETHFGSVIFPLAAIKKLKLYKYSELGVLTIDGGKLSLEYVGETMGFGAIDGTFPNWRAVMPKGASGKIGHYNSGYIADFQAAAIILGVDKKSNFQPVISHNGEEPALVSFAPDGVEAFGVLMPIRSREAMASPPAWAQGAKFDPATMPANSLEVK